MPEWEAAFFDHAINKNPRHLKFIKCRGIAISFGLEKDFILYILFSTGSMPHDYLRFE